MDKLLVPDMEPAGLDKILWKAAQDMPPQEDTVQNLDTAGLVVNMLVGQRVVEL